MWPMMDIAVRGSVLFMNFLLMLASEELLIDFRELIGAHSGDNMADVVWSTWELYGIQDKVWYSFFYLDQLRNIFRLLPLWWTMPATTTQWWKRLKCGVSKWKSISRPLNPECVVCHTRYIWHVSRYVYYIFSLSSILISDSFPLNYNSCLKVLA